VGKVTVLKLLQPPNILAKVEMPVALEGNVSSNKLTQLPNTVDRLVNPEADTGITILTNCVQPLKVFTIEVHNTVIGNFTY
jgi:Trk K+ transport system NAD-binding subunit